MARLMPLPLTVSCFSKIQIGFTFLVPAHPGSPGQRAIKRVCVYVSDFLHAFMPFLPPNQQCQSTEGIYSSYSDIAVFFQKTHCPCHKMYYLQVEEAFGALIGCQE